MSSVKGTWKCIPYEPNGTIPDPRSSHSLTVIDRKAYLFGGEHEPRVPIGSTVHEYDFDKSTWSVCEVTGTEPPARNAHAAAAIGSNIYIFGGRQGITMGEHALNDLYVFDTKNHVWSKIESSGDIPEARSYHAMVSHAEKLYVFGGCGVKGRMNDLYSFDTIKSTWEQLPTNDAILGRGGAGLVTVQDSIYVIGGFTGKEMNDVHRFDINTKSWSEPVLRSPIPARSVFGICSIDSLIFIVGGEVDPTDSHATAGIFSNDCYVMDTESDVGWELLETRGEQPEPRGWFSADSGCDRVLIFGGNSLRNERLGDFFILDIER